MIPKLLYENVALTFITQYDDMKCAYTMTDQWREKFNSLPVITKLVNAQEKKHRLKFGAMFFQMAGPLFQYIFIFSLAAILWEGVCEGNQTLLWWMFGFTCLWLLNTITDVLFTEEFQKECAQNCLRKYKNCFCCLFCRWLDKYCCGPNTKVVPSNDSQILDQENQIATERGNVMKSTKTDSQQDSSKNSIEMV